MTKRIGIIHTSFVSVNDLKQIFGEVLPDVGLVNIVDDSLLAEVMSVGHPTPEIIRRMCAYAATLEGLGVGLILNQCSSVGEVADIYARLVRVPVLKIDQAMADKAAAMGWRISVIATVASTMGPSVRLVERAAAAQGRDVTVNGCLVDGALDILLRGGDRDRHNRMVLEAIAREEERSDVIVLAQGSMIVLLPHLGHVTVPVLTSPRLAVERARDILFGAA
jgi:Asp/Glu/hydantoin racemase